MAYVDGYLIPVPAAKKEAYRAMAAKMAPLFIENGALRVVENWGDDVAKGKTTDFWMSVKAEADEVVVFSWIEWPSKEARDAGMKKAMMDPRMQPGSAPPVFDGKRMIFGGFATIFETGK